MAKINRERRQFLSYAISTSSALSVFKTLSPLVPLSILEFLTNGCAHQEISKEIMSESSVIFPRLKGNKVQAPEKGCFVGFFNEDRDDFLVIFGKFPKIIMPITDARITMEFPRKRAAEVCAYGSIPFLYSGMPTYIKTFGGFSGLCDNKDFSDMLVKYAQGIREFGKPLFYCTMRELNGDWFPWGNQAKTAIKTWRFMWQVFEDNGANEYATWVWETYCPHVHTADTPEKYYPGDEFVDWIGLSGYHRSGIPEARGSFAGIVGPTYYAMRQNHKDKPIMMAEFAHTKDFGQLKWLKNSFSTIKSLPGMKAAIFWNNINPYLPDDHRLTEEGIKFYRELMNDSYFVWSNK
jgi:hypothetical protein